jgi:hypothetical protein
MTGEQREALAEFRRLAAPYRWRVTTDAEGFPIAPGGNGQLEWYCDGVVSIYSQKPRMLAPLLRVPGVRRHQIGDKEFRLLLPASDSHEPGALRAVSRLLRIRTRRILSEDHKVRLRLVGRQFRKGSPMWPRGPKRAE